MFLKHFLSICAIEVVGPTMGKNANDQTVFSRVILSGNSLEHICYLLRCRVLHLPHVELQFRKGGYQIACNTNLKRISV